MCCGKRKEQRAKIMHQMRNRKSTNFTSSKNSFINGDISAGSIKSDPLHPSNILVPGSRIQDDAMRSSTSKSEEEYDKERVYEGVALAESEESSIDDLVYEWIDTMLCKGIKGLNDEFIALYSKTKPSKNNCSIFITNQNSGRNRYRNVVCLDNSRVKLSNHPSGNDYIHANYISTPFSERRFICTQAPLDSTIYDFWFMIIQERVEYIIMLTNFIEKGYTKSTLYFPSEANQTINYNGILVKCLRCERRMDFECDVWERSLMIKLSGMKTIMVTHFHWTDWPDHGIPNSYSCPLHLLEVVRMSFSPIVLHCSAGIGRTGCLVLIELVLEKLLCKQTCADMSILLADLRKQRANLIQNNIQYLYVYRTLLHYFALVGRIQKIDEVHEFINDYNQFIFAKSNKKNEYLRSLTSTNVKA
ncbi:Receptor-type tyrosine-protein phosphatase kappa [Dirofilaria immitis]